jgi:outer membrane receptor protein involved in Fe transport
VKKILLALLIAAPASAQPANDVEVPTIVIDQSETAGQASDEALDLANVVQSAAKGVTTVQEAPAIVTVITSDEIKDRQFVDLIDAVETVPGWMRLDFEHSMFPSAAVRGQIQAVQFLNDGLSLFDPYTNSPGTGRGQPLETVKRIEMITGPGGVLWGSNSLLGILNVITKDAEDVEGVETGASVGSGPGDKNYARAYVMAGKSDLMGGKVKAFAHASVTSYEGATFDNPMLLFQNPLPQPNAQEVYGPIVRAAPPASLVVNLDGKLTMGKLQLRVSAPFGTMYNPLGFPGVPVRDQMDINDPNGHARKNGYNELDRYAVLEYRTRFAHDKASITARTYFQQFDRDFHPLYFLSPSPLIVGGAAFDTNLSSYRTGAQLDGDVELTRKARLLYGAEVFHEWKPDDTSRSIQGKGTEADFLSPDDLTRLPIPCPYIFDPGTAKLVPVAGCPQTFAFPADRTVAGVYVNPQWRPNSKLIFDAGARLQVAPAALGSLSYALTPTFAGTMVWNFIQNWHFKANFTEGFRPPVFNNTSSNGASVEIAGDPNLLVEKSDAFQGEINARIFKGDRRIRELSFRLDGSYTRLQNLIQVNAGAYHNTSDRGLYSGEFLGKLYIQGGHRIELGYTWLKVDAADRGTFRSLPENWFSLATVFSLVPSKLSFTSTLKVVGAYEDPNRLVEYRNATLGPDGNVMNQVNVLATDLVMDRLPPAAELQIGLQYMPTSKLTFRATIYNALAEHTYQPDAFYDYEPHLEYLPNPYPSFRAYLAGIYAY